jgi:hypothetical protein
MSFRPSRTFRFLVDCFVCFVVACCLFCGIAAGQDTELAWPSGDAQICGRVGGSEIVITTTDRLAGAIHSLTWNGKEFIDSHDHGRQLQSACSFDAGSPFFAEAFNPTEAGSRADGAGPTSSSRLLCLKAAGNRLETTTQMAFWLRPGETSDGHAAKNSTALSNHLLRKRVTIGANELANVIEYVTSFTVPEGEPHRYAQFEAVTGYMPAEFEKFFTYDARENKLSSLSDGPGEQSRPIVFSTSDGRFAMGVYSPDQPSKGFEHAGYGRFRFAPEKVVKWNCVFRVRAPEGIKPGDYTFRNYVIVGSIDDVWRSLERLHARSALLIERNEDH